MTYFKATDALGRSFGSPSVMWSVGETVTDPLPPGTALCERGLLHAATVATESLTSHATVTWPHRLFSVEPIGDVVTDPEHAHKVAARAWRVLAELPMEAAFGPQGAEVVALIERCKTMTADEGERLAAAWHARDARHAAQVAAQVAAWGAARVGARVGAWSGARSGARGVTRGAARSAATALVVKDLITAEEFKVLYGPWREVMGESAA